jgi:phosphatidylglycerol---prolipoprotein diacylglyceryl transferase
MSLLAFPVYFELGPLRLHPHWVMEALAYSMGLYISLFRRLSARLVTAADLAEAKSASADAQSSKQPSNLTVAIGPAISPAQQTSISVGALVGALLGAKLLVMVQHIDLLWQDWRLFALLALQGKTIVGALLGGLVGVELTKKLIKVRRSTGDRFVYSVLWGTAIGRVGCFLTGLSDRTYGIATTLPWGVDFGDGIRRHPTQLYEIAFLLLLFLVLRRCENMREGRREGDLFKFYMIAYMGFRFSVDFIKPEFRPLLGLSAIQMTCLGALVYYRKHLGLTLRLWR